MTSVFKRLIRRSFNYLGYEITQKVEIDSLCEGLDQYLLESKKAKMDVNDWIEERLGWEPALPLLKKILFPYLNDNHCVCEIGPGTGRHARHIQPQIERGELHLFDHSAWVINHLVNYFSNYKNIYVHKTDGISIELQPESVDICFSNGTFIELKLGTIMLYAKEFWRVLKKGGYAIFDYIDISTEGGWQYLNSQSSINHKTFTYHCGHTIDKVFDSAGFTPIERYQDGKSTYIVFHKE